MSGIYEEVEIEDMTFDEVNPSLSSTTDFIYAILYNFIGKPGLLFSLSVWR